MALAIPSLSSALQNLIKPATSGFSAPVAPNFSSFGFPAPSPLQKTPATPNMSVFNPATAYNPPTAGRDPRIGANASYVNPADATASKGTVPFVPSGVKGGGMSVMPNMTSFTTGKPASSVTGAVTPKSVSTTPTSTKTPSVSKPSTSSLPPAPTFEPIPDFGTASSMSAPSASTGGYNAGGVGSAAPIYTPNATTAVGGMNGMTGTIPSGAGGIDVEKLLQDYQATLEPSDEEKNARKRLEALTQGASQAYVNAAGQPIPLPFITGQQAQIQRSQALLASPLEAQLKDLSEYRTARGEALKSIIGRYDEQNKPVSVAAGSTYGRFDPKTGAFSPLYTAPSSSASGGFSLAPGEVRYDAQGNIIATGGPKPEDAKDVAAREQKVRNATNQANDAITAIDKALTQTAGAFTTGLGSLSAAIPGTPAANLSATISTIKSVVAFQALQAMREASPTGGALGAVSDNEGRLLANSIAALDQSQSREQLEENLRQVRQHFVNLQNIIAQGQQQGAGGGTEGGGGLYDF